MTKNSNSSSPQRRKALQFVQSGARDTESLHRHMFQEDVQLMGHFSRHTRDEENVTLRFEGTEEECVKADAVCTSIAGDTRHWREDNIAGAIENVVLHLAYQGTALFEISDESNSSKLLFSPVNRDYVWNLPYFYLQIAPRAAWKYIDAKYVVLRKRAVWQVDMPQELGGASAFRKILREMSAWSSLGPKFYEDDLKRRELTTEFIFGDYRKAHQTQLYRVTRKWGWGGRDWQLDYVTEYYQFYRHLTFKWSKAVLREHIVSEINSLFHRLGISAQIIVEGLSSPADILMIREQMRVGTLDFAAATKAVR